MISVRFHRDLRNGDLRLASSWQACSNQVSGIVSMPVGLSFPQT